MIHATIIGNLGKDPNLRTLDGGNVVLNFSVGCRHGFGDKQVTNWVEVAVWGKRGESLAKLVTKGSRVAVRGALSTREWTDKEGNARTSLTMSADEVELLSTKDETEALRAKAASEGGGRPQGQGQQRPAQRSAPQGGGGGAARAAPAAAPQDDYDYGYGSDDIPFVVDAIRLGWFRP